MSEPPWSSVSPLHDSRGRKIGRVVLVLAAVSVALVTAASLRWGWQGGAADPVAALSPGLEEGAGHPATLDDDGRFSGPGGVWPPQPRNASEVTDRPIAQLRPRAPQAQLSAADSRARNGAAPSAVVAGDSAAQAALGAEPSLIAVESDGRSTRMVWFSRSTNQTVEVTVAGDRIEALTTRPAREFQPELAQEEKEAAVALARDHWEARGDARIGELEGFAILAFEPSGAFYDTRMVYVSFHADQDARPELLTWVDLTGERIERAEVER